MQRTQAHPLLAPASRFQQAAQHPRGETRVGARCAAHRRVVLVTSRGRPMHRPKKQSRVQMYTADATQAVREILQRDGSGMVPSVSAEDLVDRLVDLTDVAVVLVAEPLLKACSLLMFLAHLFKAVRAQAVVAVPSSVLALPAAAHAVPGATRSHASSHKGAITGELLRPHVPVAPRGATPAVPPAGGKSCSRRVLTVALRPRRLPAGHVALQPAAYHGCHAVVLQVLRRVRRQRCH
mmetsp:Transcript_63057/g.169008  ORF Transcript_63057/g.169008 Transcript_63057/m.169008 type:complete len:237 (-) Transcript_63057:406-1116(-)